MPRTVRFHSFGGPEVLRLDETDVPAPGRGEVRIRTRALGLNRAEAMFRAGDYTATAPFPSPIGYEAAGEVEAVSPGVSGLAVGDAVSVVPAALMHEYGMHGELVLAPARGVVRHPARLSWREAASVWMMFVTAYGGLIEVAELRADDTVLVTAASSSTGLAAIQIARAVGARPVALTRTGAKRRRLLDAGAEAVIATEEEDPVARVRELTGGAGARVVFDPVGGDLLRQLAEATAKRGVIVLYGSLRPEPAALPTLELMRKGLTVRGYTLWELTLDDERRRAAVDFVTDGLSKGTLTPALDPGSAALTLDDIAEAHRYLEAGDQVGKIVLTVPR